MEQKLKLHFGCGAIRLPGYVNVDIDPQVLALDLVDDISKLEHFDENSVDDIYACHVLEHFAHDEVLPILRRWNSVLKPGGEIRISVPDLDRIVTIYVKNWQHFQTAPHTPWIGLIYGGQTDQYDFHKTGFNFCYLRYLLEQAGYENIEEYPHFPHFASTTEIQIKDASLANEPFNEYISLNIKASKKPASAIALGSRGPGNISLDILHTVEFYHPHLGGAEKVVQSLSEELVKRGHRVTVATTALPEREETSRNGVEIVGFNVSGRLPTGIHGEVDKYLNFLRQPRWDVVMNYAAQQWATDVAFASIQATRNSRANILACCGYSALSDEYSLRSPEFGDYFSRMLPAILPLYTKTVCHSALYKDHRFNTRLGLANQCVIPNGICESEFMSQSPINFRAKFDISTPYMALCVANFYPGKGHERVIDCFLTMQRPDLTLVLIGKEGERITQVQSLSQHPRIRLYKDLSRTDTVAAFHSADLFLFGSEIEAFPLVILEAMASRTPFVSTDCGNVRELRGGVVCAPHEMAATANQILDQQLFKQTLVKEGFEDWRTNYTLSAVTDRWEQLYLSCLREFPERIQAHNGKCLT